MNDARLPVRFWNKVVEDANGCWVWTAARNEDGYGRFNLGGRNAHAHRVAYEHLVGPSPDGLQLDHLCRNRACVNPAHLEPVTNHVNCLRGNAGQYQRDKTHCAHGHPYSGDNLILLPGSILPQRKCRACTAEYQRTFRAKKKASR